MKYINITLVFFLLIFTIESQAETNGLHLQKYCDDYVKGYIHNTWTSPTQSLNAGKCAGSVMSMAIMFLQETNVAKEDSQYCFTGDVINRDQFVQIVLKYLKDNPKKLNQIAEYLILDSLREAYPCN